MPITLEQTEQIAALTYDPGYILLMDALQAQIDDLANRLDEAHGSDEQHLLGRWRAMRQTRNILTAMPQEIALRIEEEKAARDMSEGVSIGSRYTPRRVPMTPQALELLKQEYDRRIVIK